VITLFPPLTDIGDNMATNFQCWGQKRIAEIQADEKMTPENKEVEVGKLEGRLKGFSGKMAFMDGLKTDLADARENKKLLAVQDAADAAANAKASE
jgi:hypothetical protein